MRTTGGFGDRQAARPVEAKSVAASSLTARIGSKRHGLRLAPAGRRGISAIVLIRKGS